MATSAAWNEAWIPTDTEIMESMIITTINSIEMLKSKPSMEVIFNIIKKDDVINIETFKYCFDKLLSIGRIKQFGDEDIFL